jgi:hypothetical protein
VAFDVDALRQKYALERDRRLRPDGVAQYVEIAGPFAGFADDPWSDPGFAREPPPRDIADTRFAHLPTVWGSLVTGIEVVRLFAGRQFCGIGHGIAVR